MKIGLDFRLATLDKKTIDRFWAEAKQRAGGNSREMIKRAPLVMQAYAETRDQAQDAADIFYKSYGTQVKGQYPRTPDGSRMQFVPAAYFLDMKSRQTVRELMRQQIWFQTNAIVAPLPISDPYQRFQTHGNKTINELLLNLTCKDRDNESFF